MRAEQKRCDCTWSALGLTGGKYVARRNPTCPAHGDDTEWWAENQRLAELFGGIIR